MANCSETSKIEGGKDGVGLEELRVWNEISSNICVLKSEKEKVTKAKFNFLSYYLIILIQPRNYSAKI